MMISYKNQTRPTVVFLGVIFTHCKTWNNETRHWIPRILAFRQEDI